MNLMSKQQNWMFAWSMHLAGVTVIVLVLGGFYALIYQPLQRKQATHIDRTEQLEQLLSQSGTDGREYRQLRALLTKMQGSLADLRQEHNIDPQAETWIDSIRRVAAKADLKVLDSQIGETTTSPTHSQTEIEFRCLGSYASICQFLEQAEQLTRTVKLSNLELEAGEKSNEYPVQLTFVLYSKGKSHDTKEKRGVL